MTRSLYFLGLLHQGTQMAEEMDTEIPDARSADTTGVPDLSTNAEDGDDICDGDEVTETT